MRAGHHPRSRLLDLPLDPKETSRWYDRFVLIEERSGKVFRKVKTIRDNRIPREDQSTGGLSRRAERKKGSGQSAWLYETLSPHVDEIVVAGVTESRGQKNNRRDAYGLAEKLRTGALYERIFKARRQFTMFRARSRAQITATLDPVRVQARLKNLYRSWGIQTPDISVYSSRRVSARLRMEPVAP